ncbi:uncharacterized protein LOC132036863 [Lycium ferocissimum]|uniref:uncharacterized protein LOC132036863 n=1 Tax=Lycium ferocissimum TaxID=112874 RepID=UPI00281646AF|nr:uncharacterized protein LOC132036863 [Lycium ferocissimum]
MLKRGNRMVKQRSNAQSVRMPVITTFLILICVLVWVLYRETGEKSDSLTGLIKENLNSVSFSVKLDPTVEFRNGTDLIWQIPDSPKAILFLAHGCNGKAANFWDRSPKCPNCVGLPEERLITLNALAKRFAVLGVSSSGRCWSMEEERFIIKDIIEWWVVKQKLQSMPLVALGASSGGYFVSVLATDLRFSSITIMIAEGLFDQMDILKSYPPTLFVHMPKDKWRRVRIERYLTFLKGKGIEVAEVKCMEFALSPNLLADRIPGLDLATSRKLYSLFQEKGFIDAKGFMRNDGRAIQWKAALKEREIILPDKSIANHIQEEMNLAFAYHEMTSLPSEQIFNWFETHMS